MHFYEWCIFWHDAILCMMQYYVYCHIMHDAIICMMQHYAWCNIMHDAKLCMQSMLWILLLLLSQNICETKGNCSLNMTIAIVARHFVWTFWAFLHFFCTFCISGSLGISKQTQKTPKNQAPSSQPLTLSKHPPNILKTILLFKNPFQNSGNTLIPKKNTKRPPQKSTNKKVLRTDEETD